MNLSLSWYIDNNFEEPHYWSKIYYKEKMFSIFYHPNLCQNCYEQVCMTIKLVLHTWVMTSKCLYWNYFFPFENSFLLLWNSFVPRTFINSSRKELFNSFACNYKTSFRFKQKILSLTECPLSAFLQ